MKDKKLNIDELKVQSFVTSFSSSSSATKHFAGGEVSDPQAIHCGGGGGGGGVTAFCDPDDTLAGGDCPQPGTFGCPSGNCSGENQIDCGPGGGL